MPPESLSQIGVIITAHGVRGQVKLKSFANPPEAIFKYKVTDQTGQRAFKLKREGVKDELFIASIEGIKDRNEAELLKSAKLYTEVTALPKPKKNQWKQGDLIGLEARLSDGSIYGHVAQIYNFGAGDILEIEHEGTLEMLPFSGQFIGDVKPKDGYLIVMPPDYVGEKE